MRGRVVKLTPSAAGNAIVRIRGVSTHPYEEDSVRCKNN